MAIVSEIRITLFFNKNNLLSVDKSKGKKTISFWIKFNSSIYFIYQFYVIVRVVISVRKQIPHFLSALPAIKPFCIKYRVSLKDKAGKLCTEFKLSLVSGTKETYVHFFWYIILILSEGKTQEQR